MDITFIFPQKRFRIFPASSRFFQHLYMCFIDMKLSLFQKFQLQTVDDVYKPVPIDNQKPV